MQKILLLGAFLFLVSCSPADDISENISLHNITLADPDTATNSYWASKYTFSDLLKNNTANNGVNALAAWDYIRYNVTTNKPGDGMKILMADSGIAPDHTTFGINQSKIHNIHLMDTSGTNTNYTQLTSAGATTNLRSSGILPTEYANVVGHGTAVASLINGRLAALSSVVHGGVAWGAKLGVAQLTQNKLIDANNLDGHVGLYSGTYLSELIASNGYHIVNMSFGGGEGILENNAITRALQNNAVLFVASTGNGGIGYSQPLYPAALAQTYNVDSYAGGFLAVGSNAPTVHTNSEIFHYCGNAKAFCLVGPISSTNRATVADATGYVTGYTQKFGTSFTAPLVSGAAAVLGGAFPSLSMKNIRDFILRGAQPLYDVHADGTDKNISIANRRKNGGMYITNEIARQTVNDGIVSEVYGYGQLDVLEAVKLAHNTVISKTTSSASESIVYASPILASALQSRENQSALNAIPSYDAYGTYTLGLANNIKATPSFGIADKVSAMVNNNSLHSYHSFNLNGNGSLMLNNSIITKDLSYSNRDITLQMPITAGITGKTNFNQHTFMLQKQFAGVMFAFKEMSLQNLEITPTLDGLMPFHNIAFSGGNTKSILVEKSFQNVVVELSSAFGKAQSALLRQDLFPEQSLNVAQTISLSHKNMGEVIGLDVGFLRESKTLLGSYSSGAFSFGEN
ncbi:MAG: hypothetical protein ACI9CD_000966, partial [Candidatus Deianiraeaceae bacterium]